MKTALVTGANGGIGGALIERLERDGYRVIVHARTPEKAASAGGPDRPGVHADLADPAQIADLREQVAAITDTLDMLVCNAGVLTTSKSLGGRGLGLHAEINVIAPVECVSALAPLMEKAADPTVVVVSSTAANMTRVRDFTTLAVPDGSSLFGHYAVSKAAANRAVLDLATAYPNLRVISVEPGFVNTNMTAGNVSMPFFMRWLAPYVGASVEKAAARCLDTVLAGTVPSGTVLQNGKPRTKGVWLTDEARNSLAALLVKGGVSLPS